MRSRNADRAGTLLAVLAILTVTLVLFSSVLRHGSLRVIGPPHTDMAQQFFPLRAFVHNQAAQGGLPMWNPHLAGGVPLHAEGQAGLFYPLGMALSFLPPALAINLYSWLHLAAAGLALFFYLRTVGVSHGASLFGALFFAFSSVPLSRFYSGHYSMVPFVALAPALMWAWEKHRAARPGAAASAALLYGAAILAAHPQSLFYLSLCLAWHIAFDTVWGAGAWFRSSRPRDGETSRRLVLRPVVFGAALALGVGTGAVQLFPSLSFAGRSFRQETSLAFCSVFSLAPESLSTFLVPGFFGDMARGPYWGRNYLWEMWGYVGIVPLALALAVALRPRGRAEWAHAAALPVFVVLALGAHTPVFGFLYRWFPGFDMFRGSSKFLFYVVLSLAVLAARGVDRLLRSAPRDRTDARAAGLLGVFVAIGVGALVVLGRDAAQAGSLWRGVIAWRASLGEDYSGLFRGGADAWPYAAQAWALARWWLLRMLAFAAPGMVLLLFWRRLRRHRAWVALLLLGAVSVPDVYLFARGYVLSTDVDSLLLPDALRKHILSASPDPARVYSAGSTAGNALMADGIDTIQGYVGLLPARSNAWLSAVSGYPESVDMASSPPPRSFTPALLRANVQYLATDFKGWAPGDTARVLAEAQGQRLYRVSGEHPRARFARQLRVAGSAAQARAMLVGWMESGEANPPDIVEAAGTDMLPTVESGEGAVRWIDRQPDRIVLETTAPSSGTLIVYEAWGAGWRCVVDGERETPIFPANVMWRAVAVPAGRRRLEFVYRPPGLALGAAVSAGSLSALLAIVAFRFLRDRSRKR